jgi:hypothetical protein
MGSDCEPWLARYAVEFLKLYLHVEDWRNNVANIITKFPEDIRSRWKNLIVNVPKTADGIFDLTEYTAVKSLNEKFDYISIDGRNGVECFKSITINTTLWRADNIR